MVESQSAWRWKGIRIWKWKYEIALEHKDNWKDLRLNVSLHGYGKASQYGKMK